MHIEWNLLVKQAIGSLLFSAIGLTIMLLFLVVMTRVLPFSIRKEIEEDQNIALGIIMGAIIIGILWAQMYDPSNGLLNGILTGLGFDFFKSFAWLGNEKTAMGASIFVIAWSLVGFYMVLFVAGIKGIPSEVYEAARVDGINPIRVFFRVTLPLIRPALLVAVIFRALDALRVFDLVYVLTSNSAETASMSVYARQQLVDFQEVGLGSAASTLIFLIIALLTVVYLISSRVSLDAESTR